MMRLGKWGVALALWAGLSLPAQAAVGDLLVAPTRVVLDGPRGTEVFLNNVGTAPATYRISLELRRMRPDGTLEDIAADKGNPKETQALGLIRYNPRKITLPPNQPQAIRVGLVPTPGLADGEYRVHMLFRAIPDAKPAVTDGKPSQGISISLTPIYGITIPIIVRQGNLTAQAAIANPRIIQDATGAYLTMKLSRGGTRSVYGRVRVTKSGVDKPLIDARGIGVYTEVNEREVRLPIDAVTAAQMKGQVKIQYIEETDTGGGTLAEIQTILN